MKLMAFDLATNTGVAIGMVSESPVCHSERLGDPGASQGVRFEQTFRMMRRLINNHEPDFVVIEAALASGVQGKAQRVQLAMGFRAIVAAVCSIHKIKFDEYAVQSVRKHFIGHAGLKRAKAKAMTIQKCRDLGWRVDNDNEGDAAATWSYARAKLTPEYQIKDLGGLFSERS